VEHIKAGDRVLRPDKLPYSLIFLFEGTLRVAQSADKATREILLYRFEAGVSCVLTTACMPTEDIYEEEKVGIRRSTGHGNCRQTGQDS